jgi:hypothetical protein
MNDERRGWRALPPPLGLGLGLIAVQTVVMAAYTAVFAGPYGAPPSVWISNLGVDAAGSALCAYGAAELAQRSTGTERRGLQIASTAWLAALVMQFVGLGAFVLLRSPWSDHDDGWVTLDGYLWFVIQALPGVGLAVATGRRHRVLALVAGVIAVASHPPPFVLRALWRLPALAGRPIQLLTATLALLGLVMVAVLVVRLAPVITMPAQGRAAAALRRAAVALRIWMIAVIAGTVPLLLGLQGHGAGAFALYKLGLVGGAALHAGASGWLAFGLLGAARAGGLSRGKLVVAGAASLWCGGVMLTKLVFLYASLYGSRGRGSQPDHETLALAVPLVALAGIAMFATEIGSFVGWYRQQPSGNGEFGKDEAIGAFAGLAARHREEQLRRDATGNVVWIILLMLASAGIQGWISRGTASTDPGDHMRLLMVMAAGCSLVALRLIARLCSEAAQAFDRQPDLPAARVVGAG